MPPIKPDYVCKNDKNYCMVFNLKCCEHNHDKTTGSKKCDNLKVAVYHTTGKQSEANSCESETSSSTPIDSCSHSISVNNNQQHGVNKAKTRGTQTSGRIRSCTDLVKKIRGMLDAFESKGGVCSDAVSKSDQETGSNRSSYEQGLSKADAEFLKKHDYSFELSDADLHKLNQSKSVSDLMSLRNSADQAREPTFRDAQTQTSDQTLGSKQACNSRSREERSYDSSLLEESINEDKFTRSSGRLSRSKSDVTGTHSASENGNKSLPDYRTESDWKSGPRNKSTSDLNVNLDEPELTASDWSSLQLDRKSGGDSKTMSNGDRNNVREDKMSNISSVRSLKSNDTSLLTSSNNRAPTSDAYSQTRSSNRTDLQNFNEQDIETRDSSMNSSMATTKTSQSIGNNKKCVVNNFGVACCCKLSENHQHCCSDQQPRSANEFLKLSERKIQEKESCGSPSECTLQNVCDCKQGNHQQQQQQQQRVDETQKKSAKKVVYQFNIKLK